MAAAARVEVEAEVRVAVTAAVMCCAPSVCSLNPPPFAPTTHPHYALFSGQLKKRGVQPAYQIPLLVPFATPLRVHSGAGCDASRG